MAAPHTNHFSHINSVGTTFTPITEVSTEKRIKKTIFDDLVTRVNAVRASWHLGAVSSGAVVGAKATAANWNAGVATPSTIYRNTMSVSDYVGKTGTVVNSTASETSGTAIGTTISTATAGVTRIQDTPYAAALTALGSKYCTSNAPYTHSDHNSHDSHDSHADHTSHDSHNSHAEHSSHDAHSSHAEHGAHSAHASSYST